jgi:zinc and cadmium transporter
VRCGHRLQAGLACCHSGHATAGPKLRKMSVAAGSWPGTEIAGMAPMLLAIGVYALLVFVASFCGGWLLMVVRMTHDKLQMAVSFVAGLMLAMALLHFVPHAVQSLHSIDGTVRWLLVGFLAMFFLQRFFPHHHHDVPEGAPELTWSRSEAVTSVVSPCGDSTLAHRSARQLSWAATTVGMGLHSFVGGLALATGVAADAHGANGWAGLGVALAIILHKPFDAMAVLTLMTASGHSRQARLFVNGLFALITPVSAVVFFFCSSRVVAFQPAFLGVALAFCAGTFLCIACADLLPELQFHSHDRVKLSLALVAGLGVAVLIGAVGPSQHHEHAHELTPRSLGGP